MVAALSTTPASALKPASRNYPPEHDVVPVEDDDESLTDLLRDAEDRNVSQDDRNDGPAAMLVDPRSEVDRYLNVVDEVSDRQSQINGPGDSTTVYFDLDHTTVDLSVWADMIHGDLRGGRCTTSASTSSGAPSIGRRTHWKANCSSAESDGRDTQVANGV